MSTSIIVNVYKGTEQYLKECLDSIQAQTSKADEVILVVDGYEKPMIYPGITAIIRDQNKGLAYSRNEGFRLSRGEHILFVDADDVLSENFIEEMKSQLRWNKSDIIYPSAILWARWGDSTLDNGYFIPPHILTLKEMVKQNQVLVTSLIRRKVYEDIGGFDPDLILFEDYKFFLQALIKGYTFSRANCFLKYRQRTQSRNRANSGEKARIYNKIKQEVLGGIDIEAFDKKRQKKSGK